MRRLAFSYIRFSTPDQSKGNSLKRQTEASKAWCDRNGYVLDTSLNLQDLGVPAFKGENAKAALGAFLRAIEEGRVPKGSVLVIESLDRLSRNQVDEAYDRFRSILRSGIEIVTLTPPEHFTTAGLNDLTKIITAIVYMSRAHEESATKAVRLKSAWASKRSKLGTTKLTGKCPAWLKLNDDKTAFVVVHDRAEIVRTIFRLCLDGTGAHGIVKLLNRTQVPPMGYSNSWHKSYILKILNNRSVFGEYQPHTGHTARDRKPVGEAIPNYYPPIMSQGDFYRAKAILDAHKTHGRGPKGQDVANLFSGLIRDARDGHTMILVRKDASGPKLVSSGAAKGVAGCEYLSVSYKAVESAILRWTREVKPSDILPSRISGDTLNDQLTEQRGVLADTEARITAIKERLKTDPDFGSLIDVLRDLESTRDTAANRIESLKIEASATTDHDLQGAKDLLEMMDGSTGEELSSIRIRLRTRLAALISEIWILVAPHHKRARSAMVQVFFRRGGTRTLALLNAKFPGPDNDLIGGSDTDGRLTIRTIAAHQYEVGSTDREAVGEGWDLRTHRFRQGE
ncbi:MAG: hypothetical protein JWN86_1788 [Planctomycetota bacterium]|nr:hypothetical protein [Planctomycetota bacterium]